MVDLADITPSFIGITESQNGTDENIEVADTQSAPHSRRLQEQIYTLFQNKSLLELSRASWSCINQSITRDSVQPYLRGCKWSPDGTCCLSIVNNNGIHLTELSSDLYSDAVTPNRQVNYLQSAVHVKEAGLIYDFCWYPAMQSTCPETCCWLTTRQHGPIQLWDAFDGSLRCSYRGFNAVDEMEPALSVTFSADGSKVYAGYKKCIKVFATDRPGRVFDENKVKYSATSLATSCVLPSLLAVGSWNTTINILSVKECGTLRTVQNLHGHAGGVTHMKFLPDGNKLVSGGRKDDQLLIWDLRNYRSPLKILRRTVNTNQRIYFDSSPCGRYLVSGGTDGILQAWDMSQESGADGLIAEFVKYSFPVHSDCCNGVSFHPYRPIVATASGQYHKQDPVAELDENSDHDNDDNMKTFNIERTMRDTDSSNADGKEVDSIRNEIRLDGDVENSLIFWWISELKK